MAARLINLLDFDLDGIRGGTNKKELIHRWGFDPAARFQMIGVGQRRQLSTIGGDTKGMSVVLRPAGACTFVIPPDLSTKVSDRIGIITIEGVVPGEAELVLLDAKGKEVDKVAINVVNFRIVRTRFYNLVDGKGREGVRDPDANPLFSLVNLETLVERVNAIVMLQSEVMMASSGSGSLRNLNFTADLGSRVDINKVNPFSSSDLDHQANYHVAFVWAIEGSHSNGITKNNLTLLDASLPVEKREVTLAHEFVHFLSGSGIVTVGDHDDQQSDLMFKTAPHGIAMRKARLKKIIH